MASMTGVLLRVSIFGQSHSGGIGVVLDGLPAGLHVDEERLQAFLDRRAPGRNAQSTQRKEADRPRFLSGLVNGYTCGAPISAVIENADTRRRNRKHRPGRRAGPGGQALFGQPTGLLLSGAGKARADYARPLCLCQDCRRLLQPLRLLRHPLHPRPAAFQTHGANRAGGQGPVSGGRAGDQPGGPGHHPLRRGPLRQAPAAGAAAQAVRPARDPLAARAVLLPGQHQRRAAPAYARRPQDLLLHRHPPATRARQGASGDEPPRRPRPDRPAVPPHPRAWRLRPAHHHDRRLPRGNRGGLHPAGGVCKGHPV